MGVSAGRILLEPGHTVLQYGSVQSMGHGLAKLRVLMGQKGSVQKLGQLFLVPLLLRVPPV